MTLEIIPTPQISIDELVAVQATGVSVLRSAHVGNLAPYNLTLADAGIRVLSVDHTITGVDRNYFPEMMLSRRGNDTIAPVGRLVCRAQTGDGTFVDELHVGAVRQAIPGADVFTNTEYLRRNEGVAGEIVTLAARNFPQHFNRLAMPDGTTARRFSAAELVGRLGVLQLCDDPRAERQRVIIPNAVDILINFVIEALESGAAVQYHLSGPDMIKYVSGLLPDLNKMYADVKAGASFGTRLPETLSVRLVPTACAIFATTMERKQLFDDLLNTALTRREAMAAAQIRRRAFFTSGQQTDDGARDAFIKSMNAEQAALDETLAERLRALPELFPPKGEPGATTQHDVASEGGLYVAPINRTASMAELGQLGDELNAVRKRLRL